MATKKKTTKQAPKKQAGGGTYVVLRPICENGAHYSKGDEIELDAKRAAALGALVAAK